MTRAEAVERVLFEKYKDERIRLKKLSKLVFFHQCEAGYAETIYYTNFYNIMRYLFFFTFLFLPITYDISPREEYKIEELIEVTEIPNRELEELIDWWVKKGCLSKEGNVVKLVTDEASWSKLEQFSKEQNQNQLGIVDEEEDEDERSTEEVNILDLMENFWNYIKNNMKLGYRNTNATVQNTHQVTPERLHKIVSMFMNDDSGSPTPTLDDIIAFMARKIRQNLVYMDNGAYYPTKELLEEGKTQ
uniref:Uncharacterized protein n=1 Tax=Panagrolaimus sp. JU765 TaxID=591449 RepID=A0AC34QSP6_9BILA